MYLFWLFIAERQLERRCQALAANMSSSVSIMLDVNFRSGISNVVRGE